MSLIRKIFSFLIVAAFVGGAVWLSYNRQAVLDQIRVWQYRPTSEIAHLVNSTKLTEKGKFYLYLSHPSVENADHFNQDCRRVEKASPIIGCFVSGKDKIHIYNVKDKELDGIKEITLAHEMLHVAWSRFSKQEKAHLTKLLDKAYQSNKDPKLVKRMDYYKRAQPGSMYNELHSILGTEFANLGPELESHYAKFFLSRAHLLSLHNNYNQKFISAEEKIETLSRQLAELKMQINQQTNDYKTRLESYNQKVSDFNRRARSGDFPSRSQFSNEKSALDSQRLSLTNQRNLIQRYVDDYNQKVDALNGLGRKIDRLNKSLDSLEVN